LVLLAGCSGGVVGGLNETGSQNAPGVAGAKLTGVVHGGQNPIAGTHVYLFAAASGASGAGAAAYGGSGIAASTSNASVSLLNSTYTGHSDSLGAYVLTGSDGSFTISGDYTCTAGQQVYLYALGGDPGLGTGANAAAGLMAALGSCPTGGNFLSGNTPISYVVVNEVSTVAAAYAMAGFATDATHVGSSGTALAQTGIANAFANAANLETLGTGVALATTPAGNGTVPQTTINTLANILAACVNSNGTGSACATLFNDAQSGGSSGNIPSDTATAAINLAHNPAANVAALYGLSTSSPPFGPALTAQPNDLTMALSFTGGGISFPEFIAIDASGSVWALSTDPHVFFCNGTVTKLSSSGAVLSGAGGYSTGPICGPFDIAIDDSGNAWTVNSGGSGVSELSNSGAPVSPPEGYTGGLSETQFIAIDGSGDAWVTWINGPTAMVSEFSGSGTPLSAYTGFSAAGVYAGAASIAIDGAGDVWTPNQLFTVLGGGRSYTVSELSRAGSILSGASGYAQTSTDEESASVAIDSSGDAWITYKLANEVIEISQSGAILSGASGYAVDNSPVAIAIDGSGNALVMGVIGGVGNLSKLSSSGTILSGGGYAVESGPIGGFALDGSGNAWIGGFYFNGIIELIGVATPVITPICAGLPATPTADGSSKLGTRP
jgi:hypothetical protein